MLSRTITICKTRKEAQIIAGFLNEVLKAKNGACLQATNTRIMHICSDPECKFPSDYYAGLIRGAQMMYRRNNEP